MGVVPAEEGGCASSCRLGMVAHRILCYGYEATVFGSNFDSFKTPGERTISESIE